MSSVGEIFVDIKANTKSFESELSRGVSKALDNLSRTLQTTTRSLERTFQQTAQTMNRALAQINGDRFEGVTSSASTASREVTSSLGDAAKAADAALAAVDGNDFDAVSNAADSAADEIVDAFDSAADQADGDLQSIDGGGFDAASGAADSAADDVLNAFESAADVADSALGSIDGGGFADASGSADGAADEITTIFESAADAIDGALGSIDAGGFAALTGAADSAAGEIAAQFEGAGDSVAAAFDVPLNTSGDQFTKLGTQGKKGMGVVTGVSLAAAFAVGKTGLSLVKAGERANTSNARIENIADSMKLFGGETKTVTDRLIDYAAVAARRTGADRNAIKQGQALLLTFKEIGVSASETGGNFDRATNAAIDLAAAGFGSIESNSIQLGKALNDPIKGMSALSRSGVSFTDVEKEMVKQMVEANQMLEAQDFILQAVEQQVGGTAEATMNSSDVMRESFSALKETIGQAIVPAFDGFALMLGGTVFPAIETLVNKLNKDVTTALEDGATKSEVFKIVLAGALGAAVSELGLSRAAAEKFTEVFAVLSSVVGEVASTLKEQLVPVLESVGAFLKENEEAVGTLLGIFAGAAGVVMTFKTGLMGIAIAAKILGIALTIMGGPITLIVAGIAALVFGVIEAYKRFETFRNVVDRVVEVVVGFAQAAWPMLQGAFDAMIEAAKRVGEFLSDAFFTFRDAVDSVVEPIIEVLGELWGWIDENFISTIEAGMEFLFAVFGLFTPVVKRMFDAVVNGFTLIIDFVKAWVKVITPIILFFLDWVKFYFDLIFGAVKFIVMQVFNGIKIFIQTVLGVIRGVFQVFTGLFTGDFDKAFTGIKTIFFSIWNGMKDFFTTTLGNIADFFTGTFDTLVTFFSRVPGRIAAIAVGMFDGIKDAFKGMLNFIIRAWNGLSFSLPSITAFGQTIGGQTIGVPQIPQLANGAIVRSPQLALIGEAGPEAVIPLNRPQRAQELLQQSGLAGRGGIGRGGPLVSIGQATFVTPMDAEAMAQKINASVLARAS